MGIGCALKGAKCSSFSRAVAGTRVAAALARALRVSLGEAGRELARGTARALKGRRAEEEEEEEAVKRVPSEAEEVRPARCCRGVALESRNSAIAVGAARGTRGTPRSPADSRTRFGAGRALKVPKERISSSSRSACDLGSGARPTRASERNWMATGTVGLGGACGGGGACGFSRGPSERKRRGVRRKEATCSASRRAAPGEEWREPALLLDRLLAGDGPGGEAGAERDEAKWNSRGTVSWAVERAGGFAPESDSTAASCRLHFSERALISFISRRAARSSSSSDVAGSSPHTSTAPA
mmetsp:Transcript_26992/g.86751  ORF Transcript_26992/g.86751 Transcript_26992/m.86751 type:complete len:298 (-) Transcript_26992:178-1071(-)